MSGVFPQGPASQRCTFLHTDGGGGVVGWDPPLCRSQRDWPVRGPPGPRAGRRMLADTAFSS